MAHSKNVIRFFKRLNKRTGCHAYGQTGGAYGVVAPHWLAYGTDLRPLRAIGPLGLIALMLKQRPVETVETIDETDCPEPSCLPIGIARTFDNHEQASMES